MTDEYHAYNKHAVALMDDQLWVKHSEYEPLRKALERIAKGDYYGDVGPLRPRPTAYEIARKALDGASVPTNEGRDSG